MGLNLARILKEPKVNFFSDKKTSNIGGGFVHKGTEYVHHSKLPHDQTAFFMLNAKQKLFGFAAAMVLVLGLLLNWHGTILIILAALTVLYFLDSAFNAFLIYRSFAKTPEIKVSSSELLEHVNWPSYTIFCPLYKEWRVVPQFAEAMLKMDYPKDKLQIMLLLEEDDKKTIEEVKLQNLPAQFQTIVVPHSLPKTKPKAMNYGLKFATGKYLVIYDAEDVPETDQLKKAVLAFTKTPPDTACIQAKLNFYNPHQNILTRVFTAEYSLWFDLVLTGLQSIGAPIPLGGTSNHFEIAKLKKIGGWDAFNVTEDCDLGMRLAGQGYHTAIMDSTTLEEANSGFANWYRQRSRWIKGYMQTYLVHMRQPGKYIKEKKPLNLAMLQLTVGGKILSMFINPFLWLVTAAYFLLRAHVGLFIESFFPPAILYIGVASLVFGNFFYMYYYMIGCAKRGEYSLIKYAFLVPLYWLFMSAAAWQALYEMMVKPHYWAKTVHGLHLDKTGRDQPAGSMGRIKTALSGNIFAGSFLVFSTLLANFLNLLFNVILGHALTLEDFATVTLFNTILNIMSVGLSALASSIIYKTAYLVGQRRVHDSNIFLATIQKWTWYVGGGLTVLWAAAIPLFSHFFHVNNQILALSFTPVILLGSIAAVQRGYLSGRFRFGLVGQALLYEAFSKTLLAILFVTAGKHSWASLAIPASIVISFVCGWLFIGRVLSDDARDINSANQQPLPVFPVATETFPISYFGAAIVSGLASTIFLNVDVLLAKHYMGATAAGAYSLLSLVGKMVFLMGTLLSPFVISVVSRHEGAKTNSSGHFYRLLGAGAAISAASFAGIALLGKFLVPLLFGQRSAVILPFVGPYTLAMAMFSVSSIVVSYHLIKKQYSFPVLTLLSSAYLVIAIILSPKTIGGFTSAMAITGFLSFTVILTWHFIVQNFSLFKNSAISLLGLSILPLPPSPSGDRKRILMFNWRDTTHTFAGGAEVYVHELAKRWAAENNYVTLFCGNDGHQPRAETIDGVHIERRGGFYFVYVWAFVYYMLKFRGKFDVIVDCHNGIPFFTPLFTKEKVYCLMHHVHQDVFYKYLWWPLAAFAAFLEGRLMPFVYKKTKFITISDSSKADMLDLGLGRAGLEIVHPGVNLEGLRPGQKHSSPVVLYLGRLKAYKSVDVLIRAFKSIVAELPTAKLIIAGDGEERSNLQDLTQRLGLAKSVIFTGRISEAEKLELLQKTWVLCNPSMMEGWGITSIEANACGVPVVAADVPGLRDSVKNPHTGYLVEHGSVKKFSQKIQELLEDHKTRAAMSKNALVWAKNFGWDKSSKSFLTIINANPA